MEDKLLVDAETGVLQVCHGTCTACARHVHGVCTACARHTHSMRTARARIDQAAWIRSSPAALSVCSQMCVSIGLASTRTPTQVWPSVLRGCDQDPTQMTVAPFPTGPLAVWGADLARSIFVDCTYFVDYLRDGRRFNRQVQMQRAGMVACATEARTAHAWRTHGARMAHAWCCAVCTWLPLTTGRAAAIRQTRGGWRVAPSPQCCAIPSSATGSPCAP